MSVHSAKKPFTVPEFLAAKIKGHRISMLTAYDYTSAKLVDLAGVDSILVGDSLGMVVQGHATSLPVQLEEVIYHAKCVMRGVQRALVIADLPFLTYQVSTEQAIQNAGRLIKETGVQAVKLEGGERSAKTIEAIVRADIPVLGHIGLTPQSVNRLGGFRVQRDEERLLQDAKALEQAGVFGMVLECIPSELAGRISRSVIVPTIGIGAGHECDGQVLVLPDMLGMNVDFQPKFVKRFAELGQAIQQAVTSYCQEVQNRKFPDEQHSFR